MKRITKKAINEAPKFAIARDYKASYKPLTIDTELLTANDIYEAMEKVNRMFNEETDWCIALYEKTGEVKDDCIIYSERMVSYEAEMWRLRASKDCYIGWNPEYNYTCFC